MLTAAEELQLREIVRAASADVQKYPGMEDLDYAMSLLREIAAAGRTEPSEAAFVIGSVLFDEEGQRRTLTAVQIEQLTLATKNYVHSLNRPAPVTDAAMREAIAVAAIALDGVVCTDDHTDAAGYCEAYVRMLRSGVPVLSGHPRLRSVTRAVAEQLTAAIRDTWAKHAFEHELWSSVSTEIRELSAGDEYFAAALAAHGLTGAYHVARDHHLREQIRDRFNELAMVRWTNAMSIRKPHNDYPDKSRPNLKVKDTRATPTLEQMPDWGW